MTEDPQSTAVANMVWSVLKQIRIRVERGDFKPDAEPDEILRHINTAAEINDITLQGHGYLILGIAQWYAGMPQDAINNLHTAEQFYREAKSFSNVMVALVQCADVYRVMGDAESALNLLREAERIVQDETVSNHTGAVSLLYVTRGAVRLDAKDPAAASTDFDQVFKVHERQSQDHATAANSAWRGLAELHLQQQQHSTAWAVSRLAREAADNSNNPAQRFAVSMLGARIALHDPSQPYAPQDFFNEAQAHLNEISLPTMRAILLIQEVRHFLRLGDSTIAADLLQQAQENLQNSDSPDLQQLVDWMHGQLN